MAQIIDGKAVAAQVRADVAAEVAQLRERGITPGLAVIVVGDDPASRIYVNNKKKACAEVGIYSEEHALAADTTLDELIALVRALNSRGDISGILCQLPLPDGLDERAVIENIAPIKDVDAFHPSNVGRIMLGDYHFLPCTPAGIMELLRREHPEEIAGHRIVFSADYDSGVCTDYRTGSHSGTNLPRSNVLSYKLEDRSGVIVRPSGTEPKIKVYITAVAPDRAQAEAVADALERDIKAKMNIE